MAKIKRKGGLIRQKTMSGYRWFVRCRGGKTEYWARVVYQNFVLGGKEIPKGIVVHHKDENTENDTPENLEGKFKGKHTVDHHTGIKRPDVAKLNSKIKPEQMLGKNNPMFGKKRPEVSERNRINKLGNKNTAKLVANEVVGIKKLLREKHPAKHIAGIYKISVPTIYAIKSGRIWKEIE